MRLTIQHPYCPRFLDSNLAARVCCPPPRVGLLHHPYEKDAFALDTADRIRYNPL